MKHIRIYESFSNERKLMLELAIDKYKSNDISQEIYKKKGDFYSNFIDKIDSMVEYINEVSNGYKNRYGDHSSCGTLATLTQFVEDNKSMSQEWIEQFIIGIINSFDEIKKLEGVFDIVEDCRAELDDYYLSIGRRSGKRITDSSNNQFYTYGICSHDTPVEGKLTIINYGIYFQIIGHSYVDESGMIYQMIHRIEKMCNMQAYGEHKSDPNRREFTSPFKYANQKTCIHVEFYFL